MCGVIFQIRKADVHKTLISARKAHSKGHVAVVDSNGQQHACEKDSTTRSKGGCQGTWCKTFVSRELYVHRVHQNPAEREHTKQSRIVPDAHETTVGWLSAHSNEVSPTAVVERLTARGPTKLEVEHHVASGHAQHRTWCERVHESTWDRWKTGETGALSRDGDPLVVMDYGNLKLDGTEDDDDDDYETTHHKRLILVAKDVKTGTCAATCLREKSKYIFHIMINVFVALIGVSQSDIAK